jgi:selenocysteine-specific elongation factor
MDLAMLVVAADDSVKPQTREHFEVLRLLDLPAGVIALTKCDLAEPDWIDLVEAEVRELVQGTFLETAPLVRTSAETGAGLDELKTALSAAAETAAATLSARAQAPFRMAIDRAFTIAGHGTVVTGSVSSGQASVGDQLVIQPGAIEVRVRGCQNHDRTVETIHRGQRAAINLAGVRHDELTRGHELASLGHLAPSRLITASISLLKSAPRPLKNRDRVRLHVGTAEVLAIVRFLEGDRLEAGMSGFAQLFLGEPAVTVWRQPFVLRSESPVITIGGGRVLVPEAAKLRKPTKTDLGQLQALSSDDVLVRAGAALYFSTKGKWQASDLARTAGIEEPAGIAGQLRQSGDLVEIVASPRRMVRLHRLTLEEWFDRFGQALQKLHDHQPLRATLDRTQLTSRFEYLGDNLFIDAVLQQMATAGRLRLHDKGISLASHKPQLSSTEQELLDTILKRYAEAMYQPPTAKECQQADVKRESTIKKLIELAAASGTLVHIGGDLYLHCEAESKLRELLREKMSGRDDGLTMSEIRDVLSTTRKYAVPICEYLDRIGVTRRVGDLRVLGRV